MYLTLIIALSIPKLSLAQLKIEILDGGAYETGHQNAPYKVFRVSRHARLKVIGLSVLYKPESEAKRSEVLIQILSEPLICDDWYDCAEGMSVICLNRDS